MLLQCDAQLSCFPFTRLLRHSNPPHSVCWQKHISMSQSMYFCCSPCSQVYIFAFLYYYDEPATLAYTPFHKKIMNSLRVSHKSYSTYLMDVWRLEGYAFVVLFLFPTKNYNKKIIKTDISVNDVELTYAWCIIW